MNLLDYVNKREIHGTPVLGHVHCTIDEDSLLDRMDISTTLTGHTGCVNTLRWSANGKFLASGSDDRSARIWDETGRHRTTIKTLHVGNVFGVEFIPNGSDNLLATCAADSWARLHDVNYSQGESCLQGWEAGNRVKRLATAPDEPHMFWSASEDGYIREYDIRLEKERKLIKAPNNHEMKTMAICQGRTELLAAGSTSDIVDIYDRRNPDEPMKRLVSVSYKKCSADFKCYPPTLTFVTHVAFDESGKECVVNMGNGAIMVYDLEANGPTFIESLEETLNWKGEVIPEPAPNAALDTLKREGRQLMLDKRYSEARFVYLRAIHNFPQITDYDRAILWSNLSIATLCRRWPGDSFECVKSSMKALKLFPCHSKSLFRLAKSLSLFEQYSLAKRCLDEYDQRFPTLPRDTRFTTLKENVTNEAECQTEHGRRKMYLSPEFVDYKERYMERSNCHSDIKEANFFGSENRYIVCGTDCGSLLAFDRTTQTLRAGWRADSDMLNIVQPHPHRFLLATSGIEDVIRLWEPVEPNCDSEESARPRYAPEDSARDIDDDEEIEDSETIGRSRRFADDELARRASRRDPYSHQLFWLSRPGPNEDQEGAVRQECVIS